MKRFVSIFTLVCFLLTGQAGAWPAYARTAGGGLVLPVPGTMVALSPAFNPPVLKGLKVHPDDPFRFDFILDQGDSSASKQEATRLIKYFLAGLTIPESDLWVNLSPYEKNRIIPPSFGLTEMGRDLLAEDYMLKQITASLIYPENETGKKFWQRIYAEAAKRFGTTNVPVKTFNKVWIVPEKAVVYENARAGTAYIVESRLKVMLEEDYLSMAKHGEIGTTHHNPNFQPSAFPGIKVMVSGTDLFREIVIPELTKEVNQDKNFAQLRQVYDSLILAAWYKKKIHDGILAQVYEDKNKVKGVGYGSTRDIEAIYQRYVEAFKKGAYNLIIEETDPITQKPIPRKYFSGGFDASSFAQLALQTTTTLGDSAMLDKLKKPLDIGVKIIAPVQARMLPLNQAMISLFRSRQPAGFNVLPGGADVLTRGRFAFPRFGHFSVHDNQAGSLVVNETGGGWEHQDLTFRDLNSIFNIMQRIEDLDRGRIDKSKPIVILDWGCGNGLALRGLFQILNERRRNGQGISNVVLYGFANEYYSQWRKAPGGIHFILDTAEHLKEHLVQYQHGVQLIYSVHGLGHLNTEALREHLLGLRDLLDPVNGRLLVANTGKFSATDFVKGYYSIKTLPGQFKSTHNEDLHVSEWRPLRQRAATEPPEYQEDVRQALSAHFKNIVQPQFDLTWKKIGDFYDVHAPWRSSYRWQEHTYSSITVPFDENQFNYIENFNAGNRSFQNSQIFWHMEIDNTGVDFVEQILPFAPEHFLIVPDRLSRRPHLLEQNDIKLGLDLVDAKPYEGFRIGFTSLLSGASVNHFHMDGFQAPDNESPLEKADLKEIYHTANGNVYAITKYPARGLFFSGNNNESLATLAYWYIRFLQNSEIAHSVVFTPKGLYVLPEKSNYSKTIYGNPWSFYELMGYIINPTGETITEQMVRRVMSRVTLGREQFVASYRETFENRESAYGKYPFQQMNFDLITRRVTRQDEHGHVTLSPPFSHLLGRADEHIFERKVFAELPVAAEFNPRRANRSRDWYNINAQSECPLCGVLENEKGRQLGVGHGFVVVPDEYPYFNGTATVVKADHQEPMIDRGLVESMAQMLYELGPFGFRIGYNYQGAGQEIEHQSYKVFHKEMPIETAATEPLLDLPNISAKIIKDFPTEAFLLETRQLGTLVNELVRMEEFLGILKQPFNLLLTRRSDGTIRAFVILRSQKLPETFAGKVFGVIESAGIVLLEKQSDFNDPHLRDRIAAAYRDITISGPQMENLSYLYKMQMALGRLALHYKFDYDIERGGDGTVVFQMPKLKEMVRTTPTSTAFSQGVDINERGQFLPVAQNASYFIEPFLPAKQRAGIRRPWQSRLVQLSQGDRAMQSSGNGNNGPWHANTSYQDIATHKNDLYNAMIREKPIEPFKDAIILIYKIWEAQKYQMGIGTMSRRAPRNLKNFGILSIFEGKIIDGTSVARETYAGKPSKAIFVAVARLMGFMPSRRIIVFEDSVAGVKAAKDGEFGLIIAINRTGDTAEAQRLWAAGADRVLPNLNNLKISSLSDWFRKKTRSVEDFGGVIFDVDGVIADTDPVHREAWRKTMESFLMYRQKVDNETYAPFSDTDYLDYFHGRASLGSVVEEFLNSRNITLRFGKFGTVLKRLMEARGMRQTNLATNAGVSRASITYYLKSSKLPKESVFEKIVQALNEAGPLTEEELDELTFKWQEEQGQRYKASRTMDEELGFVLTKAREKAGMTQDRAARIVGLKSGPAIYNYETGSVIPNEEMLTKLAKAYGAQIALDHWKYLRWVASDRKRDLAMATPLGSWVEIQYGNDNSRTYRGILEAKGVASVTIRNGAGETVYPQIPNLTVPYSLVKVEGDEVMIGGTKPKLPKEQLIKTLEVLEKQEQVASGKVVFAFDRSLADIISAIKDERNDHIGLSPFEIFYHPSQGFYLEMPKNKNVEVWLHYFIEYIKLADKTDKAALASIENLADFSIGRLSAFKDSPNSGGLSGNFLQLGSGTLKTNQRLDLEKVKTYATLLDTKLDGDLKKRLGSIYNLAALQIDQPFASLDDSRHVHALVNAFISNGTDAQQAFAHWLMVVTHVSHLRYRGVHPENFRPDEINAKVLLDNDVYMQYVLPQFLKSLIRLSRDKDEFNKVLPGANPKQLTRKDLLLWGLILAVDPSIHGAFPNWDQDIVDKFFRQRYGTADSQEVMARVMGRFFRDIPLDEQERKELAALLHEAMNENWQVKGLRSPFKYGTSLLSLITNFVGTKPFTDFFWGADETYPLENRLLWFALGPAYLPASLRPALTPELINFNPALRANHGDLRLVYDRVLGPMIKGALVPQDRAMAHNGGIDLARIKVDSRFRGNDSGIKFHIDPAQLVELQNAPGFVPVIISEEPVADVRKWLGVAPAPGPV